ncbi:MAG: AMP-binding protein [Desulfarculaceae bacterium]|nr:AMP-binding protein [Desulfarculaceae bacterium]MCF8074523.1 AMP-binding protein [Desulfarculaceae bacterium]MCF8103795.1 AMP-binding protein [Desulfarculaceae bacterium]MCF8118137.1 AMP-binding protein [Desulfarculaceae bacterium]
MSIARTPLHPWLAAKLGLPLGRDPDQASLEAYQLRMLRHTLAHARGHSPWHRTRLAALPEGFPGRLEDWAQAPLSTARDLREHHLAMLCGSQDSVARVVTLNTSGTTAAPKRVYFSDADLELTRDFFHHGMATMVGPGDSVLILLPGSTPDSVGDLLAKALERLGARGVAHGPVSDAGAALVRAKEERAACMVGIPVQVLAMAERPEAACLRGIIRNVLLTTDYVPRSLSARVARAWGCEVFEHYGMTETGLGGGVDCAAHRGYHLRGADLYYEVIDPESGQVLPLGQEGELVLTTLTRQAMPLLRYRTGDWGRLLPGPCPCGGFTPRMARVHGRLGNFLDLGQGSRLPMWELDEALFALTGLLDYRAALRGSESLQLTIQVTAGAEPDMAARAEQAVAAALDAGRLRLGPVELTRRPWPSDGTGKRSLGGIRFKPID